MPAGRGKPKGGGPGSASGGSGGTRIWVPLLPASECSRASGGGGGGPASGVVRVATQIKNYFITPHTKLHTWAFSAKDPVTRLPNHARVNVPVGQWTGAGMLVSDSKVKSMK